MLIQKVEDKVYVNGLIEALIEHKKDVLKVLAER